MGCSSSQADRGRNDESIRNKLGGRAGFEPAFPSSLTAKKSPRDITGLIVCIKLVVFALLYPAVARLRRFSPARLNLRAFVHQSVGFETGTVLPSDLGTLVAS